MPKTLTSTVEDAFGERLRNLRKAAGLSTIEAAYRIRDLLPESDWMSYQAIHRLEVGATAEKDANPAFLAALAKVYGVSLNELSPVAAESRQRLLRLFLDDTLGEGSKKRGNSTIRHRNGPGRDRLGGRKPGGTERAGMKPAHLPEARVA